ncbi:hypothetical protein DITRI_Ditri10aG0038800 [Diplodiscus trichospermus]
MNCPSQLEKKLRGSFTKAGSFIEGQTKKGSQEQPDVMELMQTLVRVVDRQHRIQENRSGDKSALTKFVKLVKPFDGTSTDPLDVEKWIKEIEKAFKAQGVIEEQKISIATFLLQGAADD